MRVTATQKSNTNKQLPHCIPNVPCDVDDCFYCPNIPRRHVEVVMPETKEAYCVDK